MEGTYLDMIYKPDDKEYFRVTKEGQVVRYRVIKRTKRSVHVFVGAELKKMPLAMARFKVYSSPLTAAKVRTAELKAKRAALLKQVAEINQYLKVMEVE